MNKTKKDKIMSRSTVVKLKWQRIKFGISNKDNPVEIGPKWEAKIKELELKGMKQGIDFVCFAMQGLNTDFVKDCKYEIFIKP